jgi:hypothetical protein
LFKFFIQFANLFFCSFAIGHVTVDFQNRSRRAALIAAQ